MDVGFFVEVEMFEDSLAARVQRGILDDRERRWEHWRSSFEGYREIIFNRYHAWLLTLSVSVHLAKSLVFGVVVYFGCGRSFGDYIHRYGVCTFEFDVE